MKPIVFTLTGPTCAGKSTLERIMVEELGFENLVSDTTRLPRAGEINGQNYYFRTREYFAEMLEREELVEAVSFNGEFYGLSVSEVHRVTAKGKPIVIVVEPNGRDQVFEYCKKHGYVCRNIYVGANAKTISSRFIERFIDDCLDLESEDLMYKVVEAAKVRLTGMMSHERAWSAEPYWDVGNPYYYVVEQFDEYTQEGVVDVIRNMLVSEYVKVA
jgi:guanylate kinase